jgi:methenyltetrahydromethanopterin cyclohydrolase
MDFCYLAAMANEETSLNARTAELVRAIVHRADVFDIFVSTPACGTTLIDFGINVQGNRLAGILLAQVCLADLATIEIDDSGEPWPMLKVKTHAPVQACLASQYAGWEVKGEKYFAMGSGPMRAAAGREPLFDEIGYRETASEAVGVLEASKLPPDAVCLEIAAKCGVDPQRLALLVAPTHSLCGTIQIVARSVETALHKLHVLGFDLGRIVSGKGSAPLPPLAKDDLAAIGRTNDAILYGGEVVLEVTGDDDSLKEIGPQVPSSASADYGRPFAEIMKHYNNDFYRIDPLLFSPAVVTLVNIETGNEFRFGNVNQELLTRSFES